MANAGDRVAFRVSTSDVEELVSVMAFHGWRLDDDEPDVQRRMRCVWFEALGDEATLPGRPDRVDRSPIGRPAPASPPPPRYEPEPYRYEPEPDPDDRMRGQVQAFWRGVIAHEVWDRMHGG